MPPSAHVMHVSTVETAVMVTTHVSAGMTAGTMSSHVSTRMTAGTMSSHVSAGTAATAATATRTWHITFLPFVFLYCYYISKSMS